MNTHFSVKLEVNTSPMAAAALIAVCSSSCPIWHLASPIGVLPEAKFVQDWSETIKYASVSSQNTRCRNYR